MCDLGVFVAVLDDAILVANHHVNSSAGAYGAIAAFGEEEGYTDALPHEFEARAGQPTAASSSSEAQKAVVIA